MPSAHRYRPDIDGLRAVAVVPVVLFHAGQAAFSGGYVGVDVFFVISGYLITSILVGEVTSGRYSLARFYERRIRRIFPALFFVILCSGIAGFCLLLPDDLVSLAKSIVAATLFASNLFFWRESGYFDGPAELKPLLHTWSLAVEEQYYIFFPIALFLLYRFFSPRVAGLVIALGAAASLALSVWGVEHMRVATFYLLPTRAWELLLGSLLAVGLVPGPRTRAAAEVGAALGLVLIVGAVAALDARSSFPGLNALAPCLGAALIIHSGSRDVTPWVGRMLSVEPVRFIGLVSYSLYLWHWPIIVYARYVWIEPLPPAMSVSIVVVSFAAAVLSWRFIERPFRDREAVPAPTIFAFGAAAMALAIIGAVPAIYGKGLPGRLPPAVVAVADVNSYRDPGRGDCHMAFENAYDSARLCVRGAAGTPPSFVLVGDSHAGAVAGGIFEGARRASLAGLQLTDSGYRPLSSVTSLDEREKYQWMNAVLADVLRQDTIHTVIVVAYWSQALTYRYADREGARLDASAAIQSGLLSLVRSHPDRRFMLVTPPPMSGLFGGSPAARAQLFGRHVATSIPRSAFEEMQSHYVGILHVLDREPNVDVIDITDTLCDAERCYGRIGDGLAYRDDNHLSDLGARRLVPVIQQALSQ